MTSTPPPSTCPCKKRPFYTRYSEKRGERGEKREEKREESVTTV
jgi:hypothetical protein